MWGNVVAIVSKSASDITSSIFKFLSKKKELQAESYVIEDAEKLQKAVNIAEKMWKIVYRNIDKFDPHDKEKFIKLHDDFLEKN